MQNLGKMLIIIALGLLISGLVLYFGGDFFKKIGEVIPLNFKWEGKNSKIYFPLGISLLLSLILTILINIILRLFK